MLSLFTACIAIYTLAYDCTYGSSTVDHCNASMRDTCEHGAIQVHDLFCSFCFCIRMSQQPRINFVMSRATLCGKRSELGLFPFFFLQYSLCTSPVSLLLLLL